MQNEKSSRYADVTDGGDTDPNRSSQNFVFQLSKGQEEGILRSNAVNRSMMVETGNLELAEIQYQLEKQNKRIADISTSLAASIKKERQSSNKKPQLVN